MKDVNARMTAMSKKHIPEQEESSASMPPHPLENKKRYADSPLYSQSKICCR